MGRRTLRFIFAGLLALACVGVPTASPETVGFEAYEIIGRLNIFSPQRGDPPAPEAPEPEPVVPDLAARTAINVVGIVKTGSAESTYALIEENGRHRTCRIGEIVGGMLILEIRTDEVVFEDAGGPWGSRIQPPVPGGGLSLPRPVSAPAEIALARAPAAVPSGRRLPVRAGSISHVVQRIGLVTDAQDGVTRGLRLTEDFMGLREGDCITFVDCQSLRTEHPKQKLWQIASKYRTGGQMSEIPIVIERDNREMAFVLHPFG